MSVTIEEFSYNTPTPTSDATAIQIATILKANFATEPAYGLRSIADIAKNDAADSLCGDNRIITLAHAGQELVGIASLGLYTAHPLAKPAPDGPGISVNYDWKGAVLQGFQGMGIWHMLMQRRFDLIDQNVFNDDPNKPRIVYADFNHGFLADAFLRIAVGRGYNPAHPDLHPLYRDNDIKSSEHIETDTGTHLVVQREIRRNHNNERMHAEINGFIVTSKARHLLKDIENEHDNHERMDVLADLGSRFPDVEPYRGGDLPALRRHQILNAIPILPRHSVRVGVIKGN
jgi:hypothetical protein